MYESKLQTKLKKRQFVSQSTWIQMWHTETLFANRSKDDVFQTQRDIGSYSIDICHSCQP